MVADEALAAAGEAHDEALAAQTDPTRTKTLRGKYAQRLRGRYGEIIRLIFEAVRDRDVLGLKTEALATPAPNFDFKSLDEKADGFAEWIEGALDDEVFSLVERDGNQYIKSATQRGIKQAQTDMRQAGYDVPDEDPARLMYTPVHSEKAQLLYSRNYRELQGINQAVGKEISRELTDGLTEGRGVPEIARSLADRVDKVGKTRATTLAHTEIIHAHAEAKLDTYERLGLDEVAAQVEISTAGDRRVCDLCRALKGRKLPIDEARALIPRHPRCRCTWKPITKVST